MPESESGLERGDTGTVERSLLEYTASVVAEEDTVMCGLNDECIQRSEFYFSDSSSGYACF